MSSHHYPAPTDTCLWCGVSYRQTRSEQQSSGRTVRCSEKQHSWTLQAYAPLEDLILDVEQSLRSGERTDDFLARHGGIKYDSMVKLLRGTPVKEQFQAKRREEWYERRYTSRF